jgi:RNA polymerase sigma-70 factor (ECF subfamily)
LREIDGLSYQEIASAMSVPVGTVRSRVFRARDLIDRKLRRVHDGGLGRHPQHRDCADPKTPLSQNAV